ncbi:Platelet-activating factor acetylhydrolase IB subunit beta like [Dissostichus eleginoides]|uniref:Platelet-activating factor acetylhydrolase IB subunit beta like n=1 Tax=Dissostichus eleginoides TaxID=100907 RepID=A0AAD9BM50_DISEL|nr:Platelet-activating factor acetylhydrolase IB subunit beta like [Dissostichus eleginoides]
MNTTPSPQTNTTPHPSRPAQQRGKPDIVILIDSNGKFIDENKLFPTHTVAKIWCPNTQHAMDLLSEQQLGSPSHIIIHTGSNDLRSQQERVSESLRGVIEKASTTFPNSRVVMSTLLPRKDLHHPQDQQQHVQRLYPEAQRPPGPSPHSGYQLSIRPRPSV